MTTGDKTVYILEVVWPNVTMLAARLVYVFVLVTARCCDITTTIWRRPGEGRADGGQQVVTRTNTNTANTRHYRGRVSGLPVLRGQPPVLGRLPGQRLRPPLVAAVDLVLGVLGPRAAAQLLRRDQRDVAVPDADLRGRSRGQRSRGRR